MTMAATVVVRGSGGCESVRVAATVAVSAAPRVAATGVRP